MDKAENSANPFMMRVAAPLAAVHPLGWICGKVEAGRYIPRQGENPVWNVEGSWINPWGFLKREKFIHKKKGEWNVESFHSGKSTVPNIFNDIFKGFFKNGIGGHILFNLLYGVDDGGMIAPAEFLADSGHGHLRNFPHDIHRNLARA